MRNTDDLRPAFGRRHFLRAAAALVAAPAVLRATRAGAAEVTLKLHHFLPPTTNGQRNVFVPWAKSLADASGGRIKVDIYPSMQLGGAPPQLYDQARDGVVDIVWALPGYTANRFPRLEVFELPFVADRRSVVNSQAVQEYAAKHLAQELGEVHPIGVWAHDGGVIHSTRAVREMKDFSGLKLRFPTRLAGEGLKALGATPIGMPVPQVPQALAQRVIDGAVVPWEVVPAIKIEEMTSFHSSIAGSPTFYTATFLLAMNRPRYESLPDDLRGVLDTLSGPYFAKMAGEVWDKEGAIVSEAVRKRGNTMIEIGPEEAQRWRERCEPVTTAWLAAMRAKGLDGDALLADAKALLAKYAST
jgi:TRAP-type C4-dicarboxylate transport system substrate-binding protein